MDNVAISDLDSERSQSSEDLSPEVASVLETVVENSAGVQIRPGEAGQGRLDEQGRAVVENDLPFAGAPDYVIYTSQEVDAIMRAACDGRTGDNWLSDPQSATRSHTIPGAPHHVQLALLDEEIVAGVQIAVLETLTFSQDPDFNFALLYVSRLLAPPAPLPQNARATGWIDLDDIMDKIGWTPRSTTERVAMRQKIWAYLRFGARARICGQRSSEYFDKRTGQKIPTQIEAPPWAFLEMEKPVQPKLFPEFGEAPLRVELVASRMWTQLTTSPETTQYLPLGEMLGAIPGNKPSGAWARVLGLALANFWRRQPRAALEGRIRPTRRELLDRYLPKTAPAHSVLNSKDPRRAIEYWRSALQILVDNQFLACSGEAARTLDDMRQHLPRQDWQDQWLDEAVNLTPGPHMEEAVQACANALPVTFPRSLNLAVKKRRGRPRKSA
jgi:hypothetical protein